MNVFLDFEASSLSKHSYPIEIAWVFEDGRSRSFLITPLANWTDWSPDAQSIHGITREMLALKGTSISFVVDEMMRDLEGHVLHASSPSWDGKWLSVLLRAAGRPRHALRLRKSDDHLPRRPQPSSATLSQMSILRGSLPALSRRRSRHHQHTGLFPMPCTS